jgi:NADPH-dependent curcumin reductase CurA
MLRWINATSSDTEPVALGAVMEAGAVGRVTASEHAGFAVGDHVYGAFGVPLRPGPSSLDGYARAG